MLADIAQSQFQRHIMGLQDWHHLWRRKQWNNIIFSDESCFRDSFIDGRVRIHHQNIKDLPNVASGKRTGSVAAASWSQEESRASKRQTLCLIREISQYKVIPISAQSLLPSMQDHSPQGIFQYDNARPHTAAVITKSLISRQTIM